MRAGFYSQHDGAQSTTSHTALHMQVDDEKDYYNNPAIPSLPPQHSPLPPQSQFGTPPSPYYPPSPSPGYFPQPQPGTPQHFIGGFGGY